MKILFIGDIFGRPGRETVQKLLPDLITEYSPDLVLANAENLSHGSGFSRKTIAEMRDAGVDFFTTGNHVWDNSDGVEHLSNSDFPVIRPANFPDEDVTPGKGFKIIEARNGEKVLVINLLGKVFMKKDLACPFRTMDRILEETKDEDVSAIFLDFHAETTAEKYALAYHLDGHISAMVGTHTHIQTNDARVVEKGTGYISDTGMTGPYDSVIGVQKELVLKRFLTQLPVRFEPETSGQMVLSAFFVEVDPKTQKALRAENIKKII